MDRNLSLQQPLMGRPRIRSIKPEIWQSEDFVTLRPVGQVAFIALITLADDDGRIKASAAHLARIIHASADDHDDVLAALMLMEERGMIHAYEVGGAHYFALLNWRCHQQISPSHYRPSSYPEPPSGRLRKDPAKSGQRRRNPVGPDPDRTGSGPDQDQENGESALSLLPEGGQPLGLAQQARLVFEEWLAIANKNPRTTRFIDQRETKVRARLREYPLEDVLDAVRGWRLSPWHQGENAEGRVWDDLKMILRDGAQVERFRDLQRGTAPRPVAINETDRRVGGLLNGAAHERLGEKEDSDDE